MARTKRTAAKGTRYYRHTLPVRLMHWINVIVLVILLMSGLNIFNAHSALYWGEQSYRGVPPFLVLGSKVDEEGEVSGITRIFGHDFDTTGFLGVSRDAEGDMGERGFPSWLTIPATRWLAMARRWHFFFAWLLVLNGVCFVGYSLASRHLHRDILPTRKDLHSIGASVVDHLRFRRPKGEAARHYNVLQKLAYLSVVFLLLPLVILMGFGMSPALDALVPGWVGIFGGRQSVRTIHFIVAWALVLFTIIHVFQVIVNGFWNNLRSMITGYFRVEPEVDDE
ncbi:cytochrome b/b6 domain-containing protein [Geobacter sp.]|uniref:cytochrome b/b6 domain-containing protein n=1 Tax=Geobacter sp. TaxID=46610 RepID=UPI00261F2FEC|nr:cytochrome b/b6 domain-containing protein [Geobacter sp.]